MIIMGIYACSCIKIIKNIENAYSILYILFVCNKLKYLGNSIEINRKYFTIY